MTTNETFIDTNCPICGNDIFDSQHITPRNVHGSPHEHIIGQHKYIVFYDGTTDVFLMGEGARRLFRLDGTVFMDEEKIEKLMVLK